MNLLLEKVLGEVRMHVSKVRDRADIRQARRNREFCFLARKLRLLVDRCEEDGRLVRLDFTGRRIGLRVLSSDNHTLSLQTCPLAVDVALVDEAEEEDLLDEEDGKSAVEDD